MVHELFVRHLAILVINRGTVATATADTCLLESEGTKRATSVNLQLPCLRKDLRTGSISRDVMNLSSEFCSRRSGMFTEVTRLVPPEFTRNSTESVYWNLPDSLKPFGYSCSGASLPVARDTRRWATVHFQMPRGKGVVLHTKVHCISHTRKYT